VAFKQESFRQTARGNVTEDTAKIARPTASNATKVGIGFGSALAITISWSANKSILWAIIDGFLSWIYVIYYALKHH
jgi:hypothetical protein